jgi:hypothetical protein
MKTLLLSALLISVNAFAWGPTGHRTVGEVAQRNLSTKAELEIFKILKGKTLARVATWPDEIKSEPGKYKYTFYWHYTEWPQDAKEPDETHNSGKLMTALSERLKVLKDPAASAEDKEFSLTFLVHIMGDLHQPLHVGNGLDNGGNNCKVSFQGKAMNLHALWDDGMIDFNKLSFTELAGFVSQGKTAEDRANILKGSFLDWAQESKNILPSIYPENVKAPKDPMSTLVYCQKGVGDADVPKLGYDYSYKFMPIVERRLYEAGLRLASILNQTFSGN